jgi:uncharacterized protein (TIGR03790 family)
LPRQLNQLLSTAAILLLAGLIASAQTPDQVLVVTNSKSAISREIGEYYVHRRGIPLSNVCMIATAPQETIARSIYNAEIETPIGAFLKSHGLQEKILYIVLTSGVPLRVDGPGDTLRTERASVDSELTLLYRRIHGSTIPLPGPIDNPFYRQQDTPFRHPAFPMYLVTRLDGYSMSDMKGMVDRALLARNTGKFVIDLKTRENNPGNQWLRTAALLLPKDRVVLDESATVLAGIKDVIGYASWGSNDTDRKRRFLGFGWLPGAIATEFVSFDARTFRPPPEKWEIGDWNDKRTWYGEAPQSLTADYIHEGATGASGQVFEPYLAFCPRPDLVLPAYFAGHTLAESFYAGIPGLSWMNVVVGDPLTRLRN